MNFILPNIFLAGSAMSYEGSNANEQPNKEELQQFLNKNLSEVSNNLHTSERVHSAVDSIEEFFGLNLSEEGRKAEEDKEIIDLQKAKHLESHQTRYEPHW